MRLKLFSVLTLLLVLFNNCKYTNKESNTAVTYIQTNLKGIDYNDTEIVKIPIIYHIVYQSKYDLDKSTFADTTTLNVINNKLNDAFRNRIVFIKSGRNRYHVSPYTLIELYNDYKENEGELYEKLIDSNTIAGYYNVFIIKTTPNTDGNTTLLGFTPVVLKYYYQYKAYTPEYDNTVVTYQNLFDFEISSTIIHETGHWLSLVHTFEMSPEDLQRIGLIDSYQVHINYMNYNHFISTFTPEQINIMVTFAKDHRDYLLLN